MEHEESLNQTLAEKYSVAAEIHPEDATEIVSESHGTEHSDNSGVWCDIDFSEDVEFSDDFIYPAEDGDTHSSSGSEDYANDDELLSLDDIPGFEDE